MSGIVIRLAGVQFNGAQENIKRFGCTDIGSYALIREPENEYDSNAIKVMVGEFFMGYVPREVAAWLAPLMDSGRNFSAYFVRRNESPNHETVGRTIRIREDERKITAF